CTSDKGSIFSVQLTSCEPLFIRACFNASSRKDLNVVSFNCIIYKITPTKLVQMSFLYSMLFMSDTQANEKNFSMKTISFFMKRPNSFIYLNDRLIDTPFDFPLR